MTEQNPGWQNESLRHAEAKRYGKASATSRPVYPSKKRVVPIESVFNGTQERVVVKGISKSRWRCPECKRALLPNSETGRANTCRIHGNIEAYGLKPEDLLLLSDKDQEWISKIGTDEYVKAARNKFKRRFQRFTVIEPTIKSLNLVYSNGTCRRCHQMDKMVWADTWLCSICDNEDFESLPSEEKQKFYPLYEKKRARELGEKKVDAYLKDLDQRIERNELTEKEKQDAERLTARLKKKGLM